MEHNEFNTRALAISKKLRTPLLEEYTNREDYLGQHINPPEIYLESYITREQTESSELKSFALIPPPIYGVFAPEIKHWKTIIIYSSRANMYVVDDVVNPSTTHYTAYGIGRDMFLLKIPITSSVTETAKIQCRFAGADSGIKGYENALLVTIKYDLPSHYGQTREIA